MGASRASTLETAHRRRSSTTARSSTSPLQTRVRYGEQCSDPVFGQENGMIDDMGIFRTAIELAPLHEHDRRVTLTDVMVDTGSEYTWIPRPQLEALSVTPVRIEQFESADGRILEREIGFAMLYTGGRSTPTIVVFADTGDLTLLGAVALEGLNLRIDLGRKQLVPAGPVPVAGLRAA